MGLWQKGAWTFSLRVEVVILGGSGKTFGHRWKIIQVLYFSQDICDEYKQIGEGFPLNQDTR